MKNLNENIRELIRKSGLHQYEVAMQIGINEFTFIRWLRVPLNKDKEKRIRAAIAELSKQNAKCNENEG